MEVYLLKISLMLHFSHFNFSSLIHEFFCLIILTFNLIIMTQIVTNVLSYIIFSWYIFMLTAEWSWWVSDRQIMNLRNSLTWTCGLISVCWINKRSQLIGLFVTLSDFKSSELLWTDPTNKHLICSRMFDGLFSSTLFSWCLLH